MMPGNSLKIEFLEKPECQPAVSGETGLLNLKISLPFTCFSSPGVPDF
jgi:hypothetical protein